MSSLSDMMSTAIAGLLSAALSHFGATGHADHPQPSAPPAHERPPADHPSSTRTGTGNAPVPSDDDRFAAPDPDAGSQVHTVATRPNIPGHAS